MPSCLTNLLQHQRRPDRRRRSRPRPAGSCRRKISQPVRKAAISSAVDPAAAGRGRIEERHRHLAVGREDHPPLVAADLRVADLVAAPPPARGFLPRGPLPRRRCRVLQNAWHSKPDRASSDRPSSVAVAAPLVKSSTQCGETKAILRVACIACCHLGFLRSGLQCRPGHRPSRRR